MYEILRQNFKQLLRKWQTTLKDIFAAHCRYYMLDCKSRPFDIFHKFRFTQTFF